eukprot:GHVL01041330.1.p1 GENE.GHVL01041330.1~~GHVL01041330.1.p1  ORF type:complete len:153 (+),score=45.51 GHVL01041330.1:622-1080(+)
MLKKIGATKFGVEVDFPDFSIGSRQLSGLNLIEIQAAEGTSFMALVTAGECGSVGYEEDDDISPPAGYQQPTVSSQLTTPSKKLKRESSITSTQTKIRKQNKSKRAADELANTGGNLIVRCNVELTVLKKALADDACSSDYLMSVNHIRNFD